MIQESTVLTPALTPAAEVDLSELITAESLLIALDFDGVLAPLQDDPETSQMTPAAAAAISTLAALPRTRVALVSGRDISTLTRLAAPPAGVWLVGSHGAEVDFGTESGAGGTGPSERQSGSPRLTMSEQAMLAAIDAHLDAFGHTLPLGSEARFRIERKPYSRTVHTRGHDAQLSAALHGHAMEVVEEHPGIRVIEGHDITELAVKQATKGDGLELLAQAASPQAVAYLGDDITDEDAFAELDALSDEGMASLGVKVGSAPTRAAWRIADPEAVGDLLTRLARARAAGLSGAAEELRWRAARDQD